ncbi:uncharacterized protein LOC144623521 isoform X3 [Crassostrea virginica]
MSVVRVQASSLDVGPDVTIQHDESDDTTTLKISCSSNINFSSGDANSIWNNFDLKQKAMLVSICIMATVCLVLAIIYLIKRRKPDAIISW